MRGGRGGRGIIDVVAARQVDVHLVSVSENIEHDVRGVRAGRNDLCDRDLGGDAVVAALRAAEAAEMAVGAVVILVLRLAVDAVDRIGQLVRGLRIDGDVDAEADDGVRDAVLGERGGQRAVRVQTQRRVRDMGNALTDGVQGMRDLAVAVELVAEDVVHDKALDGQIFARSAECGLVALDERVGVGAFARQGGMLGEHGDDAGQQVRARLVGEILESCVSKRLLDHAGGGGLAVRAGHDRDLDAARQLAENVFVDLERKFARQVGAAAAESAQDRARCLAHQDGQSGSKSHIRTSFSLKFIYKCHYTAFLWSAQVAGEKLPVTPRADKINSGGFAGSVDHGIETRDRNIV